MTNQLRWLVFILCGTLCLAGCDSDDGDSNASSDSGSGASESSASGSSSSSSGNGSSGSSGSSGSGSADPGTALGDPVDNTMLDSEFMAQVPTGLRLVSKESAGGGFTAFVVACDEIPEAVQYHFHASFGVDNRTTVRQAEILCDNAEAGNSFTLLVYGLNANGRATKNAWATLN